MKNTFLIIFVLISVFLYGCQNDLDTLQKSGNKTDSGEVVNDYPGVVEGIIRVKLSPEIGDNFVSNKSNTLTKSGDDALDAYMREIGAESMERVFPYNEEYENLARKAGLHLWYDIKFNSKKPVTKVASAIGNLKGVTSIEKIYKLDIPATEAVIAYEPFITKADGSLPMNDERLGQQWHYHNDGSIQNTKAGADINLFAAWEEGIYGNSNIIVAVIDGGIDCEHVDLKDNIWNNPNPDSTDFHGYNFVDLSGTIIPHTHGTHVAGTIAARNNNNIGVCGVAGGKEGVKDTGVKLMSCQIFKHNIANKDKDFQASSDVIPEAFYYACTHGAIIANNSWGPKPPLDNLKSPSLEAAIKFFTENAGCDGDGNQRKDSPMKGGIVIFAAGNFSTPEINYPMRYDDNIVVAAMGADFARAPYSNVGKRVDITAPGGVSTGRTGVLSTIPGNEYAWIAGTSMAAPHVSGVAALIISKFGGDGYTSTELRKQLLAALAPHNIDDYNPFNTGKLGRGYLDAGAALKKNMEKKPDAVKDMQSTCDFKYIKLSWKAVNDEDDGTAFRYLLYYSKDKINANNYDKNSSCVIIGGADKKVGEEISTIVTNLDASSEYNFVIIAEDRWGQQSTPFLYSARTTNNSAPTLTVKGGENIRVTEDEEVTAKVIVEDNENHTWKYTISGDKLGVLDVRTKDTIEIIFSAKGEIGKHSITVTVTDQLGGVASKDIEYEIYANGAPYLFKKIEETVIATNSTITIDLYEYIKDPDKHEIIYTAKSNDAGIASVSVNKNNLIISTASEVGTCGISITAKDKYGATFNTSFLVQVISDKLITMLYPNPVEKDLTVKLSSKISNCNISILTPTGKVISDKKITINSEKDRTIILNLAKLSSGAYVLRVTADGETCTNNFIKL